MASPSDRFNRFIPFILKEECDYPRDKSGQYSNTPGDDGGPTKFGIDLRGQRAYAVQFGEDPDAWDMARIKALTIDQALEVYWKFYWNGSPSHPHRCEALAADLGEVTMNSWVNGGKPTAWLQQCAGSPLNYIALQEDYYRSLAARIPHDRQFLPDWLGRSERLKRYLGL